MPSSRPQFPRSTRRRPVIMTLSFSDQERPAFYDTGFPVKPEELTADARTKLLFS